MDSHVGQNMLESNKMEVQLTSPWNQNKKTKLN